MGGPVSVRTLRRNLILNHAPNLALLCSAAPHPSFFFFERTPDRGNLKFKIRKEATRQGPTRGPRAEDCDFEIGCHSPSLVEFPGLRAFLSILEQYCPG